MDILILASWFSMESLLSFLMVLIGLGMVIFFHELGHFAVAKWCDVQVERFSIGFGPILWSRHWGETEYALSAIPFGGYVKMLGQDDIDPGQETSTEIAENPRSYTAKSVPQRMAIISAGVIMNVITGFLFYVAAMRMGTEVSGNEIGFIQPGMPAWEAGLQPDDQLISINGRPIRDFGDVTRGTALSTGSIRIIGRHADGETYDIRLTPDQSGTKRMIGVGPQNSPQLPPVPPEKKFPAAMPGSAADLGEDGFAAGDRIVAVGGEKVLTFHDLRSVLSQRRDESLTFEVLRPTELGEDDGARSVSIDVPAQPYRWLGLRMEIGEIVSVQRGSPAAEAGLQEQDRIIKVQGPDMAEPLEVGRGIDPARLPDWFADNAGRAVTVIIEREGKGGETRSFTLTPDPVRNWVEEYGPEAPMPISAIGVAYEFVPRVLSVEPGSPAEKAGIKPNDLVTRAEFVRPENWPATLGEENIPVDIGAHGWAHVTWLLQTRPTWAVKLTIKPGGQEPSRQVTLKSASHPDWYVASDRGLILMAALTERKASSLGEAFSLGWDQTSDSMMDIYLTLRGLFSGNISPKELHGPIGIFSIGVKVASNGLPEFLIFLGFLSVNLAVLNFLPIPVLDGGHMVFLIWEGVSRRRPNERVYATAMYLGLLFVLGLMGWVVYLDIMRRV